MWWYRALHVRLCDALEGSHGRILDAGCGTGGFLAALRARRPDLTSFGLEWDASAATRACAKSTSVITRGSVNDLPFATGSFDAALSADVLCHAMVDPPAALAELKRVLRPGGRLVLNMPAYQWMLSAHDRRVHNIRRLTAAATTAMLRTAGFRSGTHPILERIAVPADAGAAKNPCSWRRCVRRRPVSAMARS